MQNNYKIISFFLFLTSFILVLGCQKISDSPVFVEKSFFPQSKDDATLRVKTFISAVNTRKKGIGERNTFENTEVNEGFWTLSSSSNYEKNANFNGFIDDAYETYTFSISNIVENGSLKMSGSDMIEKYIWLLSQIQQKEMEKGADAVGMNFTLLSANTAETTLEVKTLFAKSAETSTQTGFHAFSSALHNTQDNANAEISTRFLCNPWVSNLNFYDFPITKFCANNSCFHEVRSDNSSLINPLLLGITFDYDPSWYYDDQMTAIQIGDEQVQLLNQNHYGVPSNAKYPYPQLKLWGVGMTIKYLNYQISPIFGKTLALYRVYLVRGNIYCY